MHCYKLFLITFHKDTSLKLLFPLHTKYVEKKGIFQQYIKKYIDNEPFSNSIDVYNRQVSRSRQ